MTFDEATKQGEAIIGNALFAASEIIKPVCTSPEEILSISRNLAKVIIRSAEEIAHERKSSATHESFAPSENMKPAVVSVSEILSAYLENPVAADRKYEGKMITVRDTVRAIAEHSKYPDHCAFSVMLERGITCYFHRKRESDIITLKAGKVATIAGIWTRYKNNGGFRLDDCQLI